MKAIHSLLVLTLLSLVACGEESKPTNSGGNPVPNSVPAVKNTPKDWYEALDKLILQGQSRC